MVAPLPAPPASASPEEQADWLEFRALASSERAISFRQFENCLSISGTVDATGTWEDTEESEDDGAEHIEGIAEDAFGELYDRHVACGGDEGHYPFVLDEHTITLHPGRELGTYTFLFVLSNWGLKAGPGGLDAAKLFEQVAAQAIGSYLGGQDHGARVRVFGFPRTDMPGGFRDAVDELCRLLGEGDGHADTPKANQMKDAKLDIVGWREFPDGQPGKLVAFAQCATGEGWVGKVTELPEPTKWLHHWVKGKVSAQPVKFFCVPHRVASDEWTYTCDFGGVLFERCRLAALLGEMDPRLAKSCSRWTKHVLRRLREK